jgi:hypothetical protein
MLKIDTFRKEFYSRFAIYMGDLLHYNSTSHIIDSIQTLLTPAMPDHLTRWLPEMKGGGDMFWWRNEVSIMRSWCRERNAEVYKHLQDFFELGTIMQLTYESPQSLSNGAVSVYINGVRMRDSGLDASYFQNETIELHYSGKVPLYGWMITKTVDDVSSVETYFQQDLSYPISKGCTSLNITLVTNPDSNTRDQLPINLFMDGNQLNITGMQRRSIISIYDITGRMISKTTATDHSIIIPIPQKGMFFVKIENEAQTTVKKIRIP